MNSIHSTMTKKFCSGCNEIKPIDDFSPIRKAEPKGRRQGLCKPCNSLRRRQYRFKTYKLVNGKYIWDGGYRDEQ
jgi:hypothetical protein